MTTLEDVRANNPIGVQIALLATAENLPESAVAQCTVRFPEAAPALREMLDIVSEGGTFLPGETRYFYRALHILGGRRDTESFPALIRFLKRPGHEVDRLLGDFVTESLHRIVAGMFDGDSKLLLETIADPSVDEWVGLAMLRAATFLALERRIDRDAFVRFLERFDDDRPVKDDARWLGWMDAISHLGLESLAPRVNAAYADGRIDKIGRPQREFMDDLAIGKRGQLPRAHRLGYIADVLEELRMLDRARDAAPELDAADEEGDWDLPSPQVPAENPLRHVGRNDPCPCGSGKKFKKCCLES